MVQIAVSAEVELQVAFGDVDMMAIVWHGHYVRYFEAARNALLDRIGYNVETMRAFGHEWPVVDLRIRYALPARFNQRLIARAELVEWLHRLRIRYTVSDADSGTRLTRGHTDQAAVDMATGRLCMNTPDILRERLAPWLAPPASGDPCS
ncbi:acyl-CoA thioester hydrolase [Kushneria sinocarnis]|uniref:Acyl-CoA thioester hydrolase n=1 Tax=Kushneria sinocarnis TaxID=595502 RepID=A0A420WXE9_9GAMM|nr:thioesterase family protein [Kushneria sinocarnis]RKR04342.1 acyl-CoA thioester hydrolase [Kushneria sinocarnis]